MTRLDEGIRLELFRTDRGLLEPLVLSGDVYIFFFEADEVVSCLAILSKKELVVPPRLLFLGVGDRDIDTGSILPFIVADANVSVFAIRSKKLEDVFFLLGVLFMRCFETSSFPFIVADANVSV